MRGRSNLRRWLGVSALATACAMGRDVIDPRDLDGSTVSPKDDAAVDPDPRGRVCRTLDDCTGPNLCSDAQACEGHRCVVVGGKAGCDDGVACTDDTCDATGGRCAHAAIDARCPSGTFCAVGRGCVDVVSCERDADCAGLGGDVCAGVWTCDVAGHRCAQGVAFDCSDTVPCNVDVCTPEGASPTCSHRDADVRSDPMNCGACGRACVTAAHQTATCAAGACTYVCEPGHLDSDRSPINGCECDPSATDLPDVLFADTNCDGLDGDPTRGVFVSPRGDDTHDGSMASPLRTIAAAVTAAGRATPRRVVYAAVGRYAGPLELREAVSIYGGYDDARAWARTRDTATVIEPGAVGVMIRGVAADMELQLVTVQSAAAMAPGASSYGVRVIRSSGRVLLNGCAITAGNGGNGAAGTAGAAGEPGGAGGGGGVPAAGASGLSMCAGAGGAGGAGVSGTNDGNNGANGAGNQAAYGAGGTRGTQGGGCCSLSANGQPGRPGSAGGPGGGGNNGVAAVPLGTIGADDGNYVGTAGGPGTHGGGGGGGGGGGSGGGDRNGCPFSCSSGTSGGGGGGGGGGCGGRGGVGGTPGGASIAVLSVGSRVAIDRCQLTTGRGGAGGSGAAGGTGAPGGIGGTGGGHSRTAGDGAAGAPGGEGGAGGGGGGSGGPSVCVYSTGAAVTVTGMTCMRGGGGPGSLGGAGPAGNASNGPSGFAEDVHTAP